MKKAQGEIELYIESILFMPSKGKLRRFYEHPLLGVALYGLFVPIQIVIALLCGGFSDTPGLRDITEDLNFVPGTLAFMSTIFVFFWVPTRFAEAMQILGDRKIFTPKSKKLDIKLNPWIQTIFHSKYVQYGAPILAVIILAPSLYFYYKSDPTQSWYEVNRLAFTVSLCFWCISFASLIVTFINIILILSIVASAFRDEYQVYPLYYDGRGGFRPLGTFLLNLTFALWGLGVPTIVEATRAYSQGTEVTGVLPSVTVILYVLLAPLIVAPIIVVSRAMKRYRDKLLTEIAVAYANAQSALLWKLRSGNLPPSAKENLEQIKMLLDLYDHTAKYPTTPVSIKRGGLSIFFNTTLVPLLSIIATVRELI